MTQSIPSHAQPTDILKQMDESKITAFHWKILLVSGMGFFTDAYDLFIIGVTITILKSLWRLSSLDVSTSAVAPNVFWLIVFRFILGVGIGGDYRASATIMSEYAGRVHRGIDDVVEAISRVAAHVDELAAAPDAPMSSPLIISLSPGRDSAAAGA